MTVKDDGTGDTYSDHPEESNVQFTKVQHRAVKRILTACIGKTGNSLYCLHQALAKDVKKITKV
jgi:hypothetical protein